MRSHHPSNCLCSPRTACLEGSMLISSVHTRERLAKQNSSDWLPFRSANSISYCCITDKSILEKAKSHSSQQPIRLKPRKCVNRNRLEGTPSDRQQYIGASPRPPQPSALVACSLPALCGSGPRGLCRSLACWDPTTAGSALFLSFHQSPSS